MATIYNIITALHNIKQSLLSLSDPRYITLYDTIYNIYEGLLKYHVKYIVSNRLQIRFESGDNTVNAEHIINILLYELELLKNMSNLSQSLPNNNNLVSLIYIVMNNIKLKIEEYKNMSDMSSLIGRTSNLNIKGGEGDDNTRNMKFNSASPEYISQQQQQQQQQQHVYTVADIGIMIEKLTYPYHKCKSAEENPEDPEKLYFYLKKYYKDMLELESTVENEEDKFPKSIETLNIAKNELKTLVKKLILYSQYVEVQLCDNEFVQLIEKVIIEKDKHYNAIKREIIKEITELIMKAK